MQGISSVTEYYNSLKGLLMELDLYQNMEMESTADSKKMEGHDRNGTSLSTFVGT